jgi:hypothetical protein
MQIDDNHRPPTFYSDEWYAQVEKLNIQQRIFGAMADAQPLAKTAKDGIKFKFHGHEGVSTMIKALAMKWRFIVETSVLDHRLEVMEIYGKPRPLCILTVRVRFVNIDSPTDFMEVQATGYGVDESDKGPGKAQSYALKMALLKTFLIYDGEKLDNELFCYEHEREEKRYNDAKQEWAQLVKKLKFDMKEEAARLKREYGDPPTLEAIQIDCDEMKAELAKMAAKKNSKPAAPVQHDYSDLLDDQPSFVDQG